MVNKFEHSNGRVRALVVAIAAVGVGVLPFLVPGVLSPKVVHAAPSLQTSFPLGQLGNGFTNPTSIVDGPGGDLWFPEDNGTPSAIAKLSPSGAFTAYTTDNRGTGIAVGSDGNVWVAGVSGYYTVACGGTGVITRVKPSGSATDFTTPTACSDPFEITPGPGGYLWFTENVANNVGRVDATGTMREFAIPTASSAPTGIIAGPDGNLWFTENGADKIGRMTPSGVFTEFPVTTGSHPHDIAVGPDGSLWFTETGSNAIGTMTTSGTGYVDFTIPTTGSGALGIARGADGALWFAENNGAQIGRITTGGAITEYATVQVPNFTGSGTRSAFPYGMTTGPDGNIWYTDFPIGRTPGTAIGRLPLVSCGDLTNSVTSSNDGTGVRDVPGSQQTVQISLSNCGVPALTSATTTTMVTSPSGCPAAASIPSFTSTLAYGQSTSHTSSFVDPSCLGLYTMTSTTMIGSATVATTTTYYVVSNGTGSHIVGDFNGDGYQDVAVSDVGTGGTDTGQVLVYYGGTNGLDTKSPQLFTPLTAGMPSQLASVPQVGLGFGFSLVAGDYNGDGYSDLAVGVPGYGYTTTGYQSGKDGAVVVLHGGPAGLTTNGNQFIPAPSDFCQQCGVGPNPEAGTAFGWSLASGDFSHNGFADLAIGSPFATIGSAQRAGAVTVMYGSPTGLGATQTVLTESTAGMAGPAIASHDGFGWGMAVGDFKHNGFADLAIASPGKAGDVVLYGSSSGLATTGAQYLQGVGPYAYQLAAGDFNGNGYSDLAVGESCGNMVEIHYGGKSGLGSVAFKTAQEITPKSAGMPPEPGTAYFGEALAAGDIKHNGRADLVISGAPAGNIVVWGTSTKLTTKNPQVINDMPQILGLADVNGDGYADLLDGDPFHDAPNPQPKIDVYGGSTTGLASTPAYSLTQQTPGALSLTGHTAGQDGFCGQP